MFTKRLLMLAAALALFATAAGCGWHRSCCRHDDRYCEPECRNYDPCR